MHKIFGVKEDAPYVDRKGAYVILLRGDSVGVIRNSKGCFLVGGGIEADETDEMCIKRECLEETGYTVSIGQQVCSAETYCKHSTIGYFHPVQTYYMGELINKVSDSFECNQEFIWLQIEDAKKEMYSEMQSWAIEQAVKLKEEMKNEFCI